MYSWSMVFHAGEGLLLTAAHGLLWPQEIVNSRELGVTWKAQIFASSGRRMLTDTLTSFRTFRLQAQSVGVHPQLQLDGRLLRGTELKLLPCMDLAVLKLEQYIFKSSSVDQYCGRLCVALHLNQRQLRSELSWLISTWKLVFGKATAGQMFTESSKNGWHGYTSMPAQWTQARSRAPQKQDGRLQSFWPVRFVSSSEIIFGVSSQRSRMRPNGYARCFVNSCKHLRHRPRFYPVGSTI